MILAVSAISILGVTWCGLWIFEMGRKVGKREALREFRTFKDWTGE